MSEQVNENPEAPEVEDPEVEAPEVEAEESEETEGEETGFDSQRALAKIKKLNSEARNLREAKKLSDAKAEENGDKAKRVDSLEDENRRLRFAVTHSLPVEVVSRLKGDSDEEMLQDAEELMKLFGSKAPPTNQPKPRLRGGGDPTVEPDGLDDSDKFAEKMFNQRY